jgi:hypothetical protein
MECGVMKTGTDVHSKCRKKQNNGTIREEQNNKQTAAVNMDILIQGCGKSGNMCAN